ncbi:MAG TPA: acetyl-CoA carboxylase carboxyl transferase subunit beta, partial [Armatimonadota bacterium]
YVSLLTDPSMAGVFASWASIGDVILAEPGAMVGFAGDRVAKQGGGGGRKPTDYQTSEFQFQHGMVDAVVPRKELRATLERVLRWAS